MCSGDTQTTASATAAIPSAMAATSLSAMDPVSTATRRSRRKSCAYSRSARTPWGLCAPSSSRLPRHSSRPGQTASLRPARAASGETRRSSGSSESAASAVTALSTWCAPGRRISYSCAGRPGKPAVNRAPRAERATALGGQSAQWRKGACFSWAIPRMTAATTSPWAWSTAGRPGFRMPPLTTAISSRVEPRVLVWSRPMRAMTLTSGWITLVGSCVPPRPTSITATSTFSRANQVSTMAVPISKTVGYPSPLSSMACTCAATSVVSAARVSSGISPPLMRILSL